MPLFSARNSPILTPKVSLSRATKTLRDKRMSSPFRSLEDVLRDGPVPLQDYNFFKIKVEQMYVKHIN